MKLGIINLLEVLFGTFRFSFFRIKSNNLIPSEVLLIKFLEITNANAL